MSAAVPIRARPEHAPRSSVAVLAADAELARAVAEDRRADARAASAARVVHLAPRAGLFLPRLTGAAGGHGLLVLEGVLAHELALGHHAMADLLGPGDLLPPPAERSALAAQARYRPLTVVRLALLGERWATRMAPYPEVGAQLAARGVAQCVRAATLGAIAQQPHLDVRVWLVLWQLAGRFGRVHSDGTHLDLPLPHNVLAALARARRPSVTAALAALSGRGLLRRDGRGWVLTALLEAGPLPARRRGGPARRGRAL